MLYRFAVFAVASCHTLVPAAAQEPVTESSSVGDVDTAITLGCMPAIAGVIDVGNAGMASAQLAESGFSRTESPSPLLQTLGPPNSPTLYFERGAKEGKIGLALAQDRPFCSLAFYELDDATALTEAALAHFRNGSPFTFSGERLIAGGNLQSTDFDMDIDEERTISARIMVPKMDLPAGNDFVLITTFLSEESSEN